MMRIVGYNGVAVKGAVQNLLGDERGVRYRM